MPAVLARADARTKGFLCIVGAMVFLTTNDSIIEWLSPTYPLPIAEAVAPFFVAPLVITMLSVVFVI